MLCPRCGAQINDLVNTCAYCGQDISIIHFAKRLSNTYYNLGLEKAKVRDLSGAVIVLKKSLQLNKENVEARNLLGLIYDEIGETSLALCQWIVSKYFKSKDNLADYYINEVQNAQTQLDVINQSIKKYNSAVAAIKTGNEDLALIQLKKVVKVNPNFIKAQQLLALIYIHQDDLNKAYRCLMTARKIDFNNTITLKYLNEISGKPVSNTERATKQNDIREKKTAKDVLENVIPVGTYEEEKKSWLPALYIGIGLVVGVLAGLVLFGPTISKTNSPGASISAVSDQLTVQEAQISTLEEEKKNAQNQASQLQKQLDDKNNSEKSKNDKYVKLISALNYYMNNDKTSAAVEVADCKKEDFETDVAKSLYEKVSQISPTQIQELVNQGKTEMYSSYETALKTFKKVVKLDKNNQEGLFCLGRCYQRLGDNKKAKKNYQKALDIDSTTEIANQAKEYLEELNNSETSQTATPAPSPDAE